MNLHTVRNNINRVSNYVHPRCIICGAANSKGLHLGFDAREDGSVEAEFDCNAGFEGYPGMVHGGIISSVLDGAMANCMFARGLATVTCQMNIRFRHPVVIDSPATVSARITRTAHPLYLLEAEIVQDSRVKVTATGKYYDQPHLAEPIG